ncbi:hypothetical protein VTK73DRAFT_5947 [Phialemonium thermophilum]|uniref:Vacuolar ATPase assembly protein VMA22 n=1 Tax=Phialemonium thermophilum TaxID=223376 RepID=A0ABR3V1A7_9PEZI
MPGTRAEAVDELLERYLELLDEYTRLRGRLSELQSRVFQHIARANFTAERGLRYGQDLYDERMRCLRRLSLSEVSSGAESHPAFRVVSANETGPAPDAAGDRAAEMQTQATPPTAAVASDEEEGSAEEARRTGPEAEERRNAAERKPKPAQQQPKDPLTPRPCASSRR